MEKIIAIPATGTGAVPFQWLEVPGQSTSNPWTRSAECGGGGVDVQRSIAGSLVGWTLV